MTTNKPDFDVVVIGGGPAGGSMGSYLGRAGVNVAVFERELFPREHVGESLVPSSTRVFKDLGLLQKMEDLKFPHKYGAVWTAAGSKYYESHDWANLEEDCHAAIRFEERQQEGVDTNYTFHVDRGKFDNMLLQHAAELGANVCEGVKVTNVDFSEPLVKVHFSIGKSKKDFSVTARMVVDGSGRHTLIGNQLGVKVRDPVFDQYAIHTWFDNYKRTTTKKSDKLGDYIFVHFLPVSNSWVWQIPITETITSIGVVTQKKNFKEKAKTREMRDQFFWETVATRPDLYEALKAADQLRPLKEEGDYSYAMKQIVGDRFVMVGDAARFVDPIFSTGVSIALNSSRFAHKDILQALETGNFQRESFSNYETTIRRGTKNWYDFISVYYRLNILFTFFINNKDTRLDVLKLLQGDVYDEKPPEVLDRMRQAVKDIESNPNHHWHKLLNDMTANAFTPLF
jgi:1H-pyrrole-2-carbonyl-[peptidyl-carrier protein] chlorinase